MLDFAKDPALWEKVRTHEAYAKHRAEILEKYEQAFSEPPRAHSLEDTLRGGDDRGLWHKQLNQLQCSAILSLIYPDNEEYFNNLLKIIWAYCDEYSWAPLGHFNSYYNRTPADFDPGLIDIFASSAGFALSEIKHLLGHRFPRVVYDRLTYEIRKHIIEPYLTRNYFWEKHDNNWASVCGGGVGATLMYECPEVFFEQRERLDATMQCYLDSFADDGVCVEGTGYWGFGFGFFVSYAMLEKEITNGEIDWFKCEKVKTIATFMQKMFLQRDVLVSFSDCGQSARYSVGLPHILRMIYGDAVECLPYDTGIVAYDNTHFNFLLRSVIYFNPEYITHDIQNDVVYNMQQTGIFIKRTKNYGFAIKGGNNGESHNHNDVGSFILARNNKQILCDIGAGPYVEGYHTEQRYTFFNPSSFSHNVPFFDGIGHDGVRRENVIIDYDEDKACASLDFKNAYGIDYLTSAMRKFYFSDAQIRMCDHFDLTKKSAITERFVTKTEPVLCEGGVLIDDVLLRCVSGATPTITIKELETHNSGEMYNVYLIDYTLGDDVCDFEIIFETPTKESV